MAHQPTRLPSAWTPRRRVGGVGGDALAHVAGVRPVELPWASPPAVVAARLGSDLRAGLTNAAARQRLLDTGRNELIEGRQTPRWALLVRQFTNTMVVVLAVAAAVTFFIGHRIDTIVIGVIVIVNASVGYVQEHRAEQAMAELRRLTTTMGRTTRGGLVVEVPDPELVPGDLVILAAGDVVPADVRLVEVHAFRVGEAVLTGESEPVTKTTERLPENTAVAERRNMAFKGTAVTMGRATGLVVATGMATEIGRIAALLGSSKSPPTPLQRRLASLGRRLAVAAGVVCAVVFAAGVAAGEPVDEMFLTAVSLAVAAIPEGLPAVVTVALALGARRMATRRAVIRRLPAVETLGSVSVICSDKTGTLTENRMTAERVWTPQGTAEIEGRGYAPVGTVRWPDGKPSSLARLGEVAAACNDAVLHAPTDPTQDWTVTGDPTEAALAALAGRVGIDADDLEVRRPRCGEVPFDADRRRMTTVHRAGGSFWVAAKGALGAIASRLHPDDAEVLGAAEEAAERLAAQGYRVLALADRTVEALPANLEELEEDLRLVALVGIADPPRGEAAAAVATCEAAGITPVMITGDHPLTATAVARRVGIIDDDGAAVVLLGDELAELSDEALRAKVASVRVYARTTPEQKLRIVDAWQAAGAVVAMTGDGVNDAPALQRADIGVAMGVTGTTVSTEASDMVLADDNFATIVAAVAEGRRIYDNIRRFVRYLLTTNSAELWVMLLAPLLGQPVPLVATQILWINLVTDGFPAIALGLEASERDTMRRRPRPKHESIVAGGLWQHAVWVGLLMAAVCIGLQGSARAAGWPWQTMVFTTLAFLQLGHAVAVRSELRSTFELGFLSNRWLAEAVALSVAAQLAVIYVPALHSPFDTEALSPIQLLTVGILSTVAFVAVELEKRCHRRSRRHTGTDGRSVLRRAVTG